MQGSTGGEAVVLRGLSKSWRGPQGPVHAVRVLDVSISRGETVALLGPNGAGKSTTIDMILGLAHPDSGEVSVYRCWRSSAAPGSRPPASYTPSGSGFPPTGWSKQDGSRCTGTAGARRAGAS